MIFDAFMRGIRGYKSDVGVKPLTFLITCMKNGRFSYFHGYMKTRKSQTAHLSDEVLAEAADERYLDTFEEQEERTQVQIDVAEILNNVDSERTRKILIMRFGLDGNPPMRLKDVADAFGLQKQRIDQIIKKEFKKYQ